MGRKDAQIAHGIEGEQIRVTRDEIICVIQQRVSQKVVVLGIADDAGDCRIDLGERLANGFEDGPQCLNLFSRDAALKMGLAADNLHQLPPERVGNQRREFSHDPRFDDLTDRAIGRGIQQIAQIDIHVDEHAHRRLESGTFETHLALCRQAFERFAGECIRQRLAILGRQTFILSAHFPGQRPQSGERFLPPGFLAQSLQIQIILIRKHHRHRLAAPPDDHFVTFLRFLDQFAELGFGLRAGNDDHIDLLNDLKYSHYNGQNQPTQLSKRETPLPHSHIANPVRSYYTFVNPPTLPDNPMKTILTSLLAILFATLFAGCNVPALPTVSPPPPAATEAPAETPAHTVTLTILYTDDEHGWMEGQSEGAGAANLLGLWQKQFGYDPADPRFLVLSGGDNWTGPAISTWFKGESMVEVMNAMGYDASAVGNHEFDFGLENMQYTISLADFPYLAANMRNKSDGQISESLGVQPYAIIDAGGLKVGVIGLANIHTPKVTNPANVQDFDFEPYVETLQQTAPEVRAAGADVVMVISHLCNQELRHTTAKTKDLGIVLFGGGHCHESLAEKAGDAVLITGGPYLQTFAWAQLAIDPESGAVVSAKYDVEANRGGPADPDVAAIVAKWRQETDATLGEPIGYLAQTLPERTEPMLKLVTETWLLGYPNADVAITNSGGVRDDLRAGPITIADIISVMPFDNVLIDMKMTGAQIEAFMDAQGKKVFAGGVHQQGGHWELNRTGEPLQADAVYHVLVNDYMYAGGGSYQKLAEYDPEGYDTGIDWRQPVIDWIIARKSTPEQPLDEAIRALGK